MYTPEYINFILSLTTSRMRSLNFEAPHAWLFRPEQLGRL